MKGIDIGGVIAMPMHKTFKKILDKFRKQYGEEEGTSRFWAWLNSRGLDDTKSPDSQLDKFKKKEMIEGLVEEFDGDITQLAMDNEFFRRVVYTGENSQLVVMSLLPNEDIGMEVHPDVDQILFFISGACQATVGPKTWTVQSGDVVYVPMGTHHNFKNIGLDDVKLYTIYSPPEHPDGTLDRTKPEPEAETEEIDFSDSKPRLEKINKSIKYWRKKRVEALSTPKMEYLGPDEADLPLGESGEA